MKDLFNNKTLIKVMWLPGESSLIWKMMDESQLNPDCEEYTSINRYLELSEWSGRFHKLFKEWLDDDSPIIYNVMDEINLGMIKKIQNWNQTFINGKFKIFYWYDVDRSEEQDFVWELSPISGERLLDLGSDYHPLNRLISINDCLVFPSPESNRAKLDLKE